MTIIPTMGARTRTQLADALAGLDVTLTAAEVAALEAAVPASAGRRDALRRAVHDDARQRKVTAGVPVSLPGATSPELQRGSAARTNGRSR